jgi:phytoene dehydrogenase-like protein
MPGRHTDGPIVVVGAGVGGLLVAAGLCQDRVAGNGRAAVVLERLPFAGGRFATVNRQGYQLSTGAVHTLPFGTRGPMARLLGKLVPSVEVRDDDGPPSFHVDGREIRWKRPLDLFQLFSPREKVRLVATVLGMGWSRGMRGDEPFGEWLRRNAPAALATHRAGGDRVYRLLERVMHFGLSAGPDDVPCCEVQRLFRNWRDKRRSGVVVGGRGRAVRCCLPLLIAVAGR